MRKVELSQPENQTRSCLMLKHSYLHFKQPTHPELKPKKSYFSQDFVVASIKRNKTFSSGQNFNIFQHLLYFQMHVVKRSKNLQFTETG